MAQIQQTIVGFELGPFVPTSGVNIGYLAFPNGYNTTDITTDSKRSGSYGFKANSSGNLSADVFLLTANTGLPGSVWEMRARYFFRVATTPAGNNVIVSNVHSGNTCFSFQLQMNTSRQLRAVPSFCGNTTTAYTGTFSTNTWYQVRMRFYGEGSGGQVGPGKSSSHEVIIYSEDGTTAIASFAESTPNGNNMPNVWPALFAMGQNSGAGGPAVAREIWYDDFWVHMATGSDVASMEWPRGTKVEPYYPTANGSVNQFSRGGTNTGANWSQVSEIPVNLAAPQNVNSATAGQVDMYQHANLVTSTDVVYHIQAVCWLFDTTPQKLVIGATTYDVTTNDATGRYAVAHQIFSNATAMLGSAFNALEFGIRKESGSSTLTSQQEFLEVLTGPPVIVEEDLPPAGDPTQWSVTAALDPEASPVIEVSDLTFATGVLGFRLGGQGVEINVPTPWSIQRVDVGYRDEEQS